MKIALILTLCSTLIIANAETKKHNNEPFSAVNDLFAAMSSRDHKAMKEAVTDDFVLLEHGEVWSITDLVNAVDPDAKYKRTNYFSVINSDIKNDMALINYWNKANISSNKGKYDLIWLESVVVIKQGNTWRLSQMHSTRLEPGKKPENVAFKQYQQ